MYITKSTLQTKLLKYDVRFLDKISKFYIKIAIFLLKFFKDVLTQKEKKKSAK